MPSRFPGMDPYLESPDIWPDFHHAFASEISAELNGTLPEPYYARLRSRPEIGILEEKPRLRPDDEPLRHLFVELRDSSRGHTMVTLVEIVSPWNKFHGDDRLAYERKQHDVLDSESSLIEIDLLRCGVSPIAAAALRASAAKRQPPSEYLVTINRAWQRHANGYDVFPIRLEERLPCIPVPLREGEVEIALDLQQVFQKTYDGGPYARGAVDYESPPEPPIRDDRLAWLNACLQGWRQAAI